MVRAGLRRGEPFRGVAPREHILFRAKGGDEEVVDDVLRSHDQLHGLPEQQMQFVDFPSAIWVLQLPHPLLGDDMDLAGIRRRARHAEIDHGGPDKDADEHQQRGARPGDFEAERSARAPGVCRRAGTVADAEEEHRCRDAEDDQAAQDQEGKEDRVHGAGEIRGALRAEAEGGEGTAGCETARRASAGRVAPSSSPAAARCRCPRSAALA